MNHGLRHGIAQAIIFVANINFSCHQRILGFGCHSPQTLKVTPVTDGHGMEGFQMAHLITVHLEQDYQPIVVNADHIIHADRAPEQRSAKYTTIFLTGAKTFLIRESLDELVDLCRTR
jgi:uncharacterized protein YlzI (FlbEa/FlbD family)